MNDPNTGYKLIAAVSLTAALFSYNNIASSHDQRGVSIIDRLDRIEIALNTLLGCSTEDFLNDACAPGELPNDVATYATFCFGQGNGVELGTEYGVELESHINLGLAWDLVVGAELGIELDFPSTIKSGELLPSNDALPSDVSSSASSEISRGFDICVDMPIDSSTNQNVLLAKLTRSINELAGKYERRLDRVLTYAETHTDSSIPLPSQTDFFDFQPNWNSDDAFDIADGAADRYFNAKFENFLVPNGLNVFRDPIFVDLATSLELPLNVLKLVDDPYYHFATVKHDLKLSTVCDDFGLTAHRADHPGIDDLCGKLMGLPNFTPVKDAFQVVHNIKKKVDDVEAFICDNVSLRLFTDDCPD